MPYSWRLLRSSAESWGNRGEGLSAREPQSFLKSLVFGAFDECLILLHGGEEFILQGFLSSVIDEFQKK